ncbi:MAG: hypothetical protein SGARI_004528 [Bacillariaceae sp.]
MRISVLFLTVAGAALMVEAWIQNSQKEEVAQVFMPQQDHDSENLSTEELKIITDLHDKAKESSKEFQNVVEEALPSFSPSLIMKLKQASMYGIDSGDGDDNADDSSKKFLDIANALQTMLNQKLQAARDTLSELMMAGEIKKLDALIGKAARVQQLDVAFFQVLQMNMQDAAMELQQQEQPSKDEKKDDAKDAPQGANRFQILQHIYTRCQEEVEKTINPGLALLNKLLRTEVDSIRQNQLQHYLCPQPTTITAPDGKQIELKNAQNEKSLVDHNDFCEAIGNAVRQIRTVEKAGGTDPAVAAGMVESCRQVAKEARIVIGEHFGKDSDQLQKFEDALMPVFRPASPESEYIKGEES